MLTLHDVRRSYGGRAVLGGVNFTLSAGSVGAVTGPSGVGKTTLLHLIAGLDRPERGTIQWGEQVLTGPRTWTPPWRRPFATVFQHLSLWPHITVADHLDLVLRARHVSDRRDRQAKIQRWLGRLELTDLARRLPAELSGGQQQRVAIARSLSANPELLLLDEALSLLDERSATLAWRVIDEWRRDTGATVLIVSHDTVWISRFATQRFPLDACKAAA